MVLCSQREYLIVDITNTENIDFCNLWITASKYRYIKLKGFNCFTIKEYEELKKKSSYTRFFDSLPDFIKWAERK